MKKKILILGGTGFFGTNLQRILNPDENIVVSIGIESGINFLRRDDIRNLFVSSGFQPDYILNMAALVGSMGYVRENPATVLDVNSRLLLNMYEALGSVKSKAVVINPISNCSYPGDSTVQYEDGWWNGQVHESVQPYGFAKKLGFMLSRAYEQQFGIKTINLIFPNAYGPYDHLDPNRTHAMSGMIVRMIQASRKKEPIFYVWGSGKPVREWIFMPDAARLVKKVIWEPPDHAIPNPLNIGQNDGISIAESAKLVKNVVGYKGKVLYDISKPDGDPIKVLSNSWFSLVFPDFKFTPYLKGIEETVAYYNKVL